MKLDGRGQAAIETSQYNEWCHQPAGTATWALIWSDGWEIKERARWRIQRDVLPVPVVNQRTNGGEPKQMLTTCLVNSVSLRGRKGKKNGKTWKRRGQFKKKSFLSQISYFGWLAKLVGKVEVCLTSELNGLFIDRTSRGRRWQGERNYMSRLIWEMPTVSCLVWLCRNFAILRFCKACWVADSFITSHRAQQDLKLTRKKKTKHCTVLKWFPNSVLHWTKCYRLWMTSHKRKSPTNY